MTDALLLMDIQNGVVGRFRVGDRTAWTSQHSGT
jgi:hypothetical protein